MRRLQVTPNFGKHCFIQDLNPSEGPEWVRRRDTVVKVFHAYPLEDWDNLEDFTWGDPPAQGKPNMSVPLIDATKIQNYCHLHGLAPQVYEIVKVTTPLGKRYWGQVQDKAHTGKKPGYTENEKEAEDVYRTVRKLGEVYGFTNDKEDVSKYDVIKGKLVDFNTFHFTKDHKEKIKELYIKYANYGDTYYHPVEELGLMDGARDCRTRVQYLNLHKLDVKDKSVLDIGCAGGWFTRYLKGLGAGRVLGIDYSDVGGSDPVLAAKIIANELGYWDIDYVEKDIRNWDGFLGLRGLHSGYNIVLFLSMNFHVGIPSWLSDITNELCIFEDNSKNRDALPTLQKMFKQVERVGDSLDHGVKPVYWCWK